MVKDKGLKESFDKLDVLRMNEKEKRGYDYYLADLHLRASLADTQKLKLEQAEDIGLKKGKVEMAKLMVLENEPIEKIIKYTGLSKSEITSFQISSNEEIIKDKQANHEKSNKKGKNSK